LKRVEKKEIDIFSNTREQYSVVNSTARRKEEKKEEKMRKKNSKANVPQHSFIEKL
jgi:hypothetical protein